MDSSHGLYSSLEWTAGGIGSELITRKGYVQNERRGWLPHHRLTLRVEAPYLRGHVSQAHGLVHLKRSGSTPEVDKFTAVKGSMTTPNWYWKNHSVQSHRTRHGRIVGMEANGSWSLRHAIMRGKLSDRLLVSYARDTGFDSQTRNSWYYYKSKKQSFVAPLFSFEELFFSSSSSFFTASHVYIWLGSKSFFSSLFISVSGYSLGFLSLK